MRVSITRTRHLELVGSIENDENREYWLLVKVQPTGLETPSNDDEPTVKVAVDDGLAHVIPEAAITGLVHGL